MHPIADLQIEYSLISRGPEAEIFPVLAELGIGVTAYGVLSRGLLSGSTPRATGRLPRAPAALHRRQPRAQPAPRRRAAARSPRSTGVTPPQLAIAWVLAKGPSIVPVIGARTRAQLAESLGALDVTLVAGGARRIEAALPAVGGRGHALRRARRCGMLDSER